MTETTAEADPLAARFEALRARGAGAWDHAEMRYLGRLLALGDRRAEARLDTFAQAFEAAHAVAAAYVADLRYDEATRDEMRAALQSGDLVAVEILAGTRPRRAPSPLRDAWIERMQSRAEARGVVVTGGASASALLGASLVEARAAAIANEARALDLESIGPYNPSALALRLFARLDDLDPSYLAAWVAWLEDLGTLRPELAPEKKKRR
jgi:hypothetical protein